MSETTKTLWKDRLLDADIDRHAAVFFRSSPSQAEGIRAFARSLWEASIDYNISKDAPSAGNALTEIKRRIDNKNQPVIEHEQWKAIRRLIVKLSKGAVAALPQEGGER